MSTHGELAAAYYARLYGSASIYVWQIHNDISEVGVFSSAEKFLSKSYKGDVYTNLQPLKANIARTNRLARYNKGLRETDTDQRWVCIDIDPVRDAQVNATDEEKLAAYNIAQQIITYLQQLKSNYIFKDSGNGYHILIEVCDLTKESHKILLSQFKVKYDTAQAIIDPKCFNNSRVIRAPDTYNNKSASDLRPVRLCKVLQIAGGDILSTAAFGVETASVPVETAAAPIKPRQKFDFSSLKKPAIMTPARRNVELMQEKVNALQYWLEQNRLVVAKHDTLEDGGYKWILQTCPWTATHTDNSAYILLLASGAFAAGCMHATCPGHKDNNGNEGWADLNGLAEHKYNLRQYKLNTATAITQVQSREINLTDLGNAKLFVQLFGDRVRYATDQKIWYVYDGKAWRPDHDNLVLSFGLTIPATLKAEAMRDPNNVDTALLKHALASEDARRISSFMNLAKGLDQISIDSYKFDSALDKINVSNGIVDLRTGFLYPHDPLQYHSKIIPHEYGSAPTPVWDNFICGLTDNRDIQEYILHIAGYCLTGYRQEQAMYFLHGRGRNGKSTFLETLAAVMGEYAQELDVKVVFGTNQHPTGKTDFQGKRFCYVDDPSREDRDIDVGLIKQVTGSAVIRARKMHKDYYSFQATHKFWIAANYKPMIREQDDGIWERIKLIQCDKKYLEGQGRDTGLPRKLLAEASGILYKLVQYAMVYFKHNEILTPPIIKQQVISYRLEMDILAGFISECVVTDSAATVDATILYNQYIAWANNNNDRRIQKRTFIACMTERGFELVQYPAVDGRILQYWKNMRLKKQIPMLVDTSLAQVLES